jgi:hypothetical protein
MEPLNFGTWLREGLRAALFLRPRIERESPRAVDVAALLIIAGLLEVGISRLEVDGAAVFDLRGWLSPWWASAAAVLLAWLVLDRAGRRTGEPARVAAWFTLWNAAVLPATVISLLLSAAQSRNWVPPELQMPSLGAWLAYLALSIWTLALAVRLARLLGASRGGMAALGVSLFMLYVVTAWNFPDRPWQPELAEAPAEATPQLSLSQESFESQQAVLDKAANALAPERPGVADVYGLVFSPYADEDVFLREGTMVAQLLAERFDAQGRVLHLANHASTSATHAWATPLNLRRALDAIAQRMDRENDLLVVYLTSHGADNFRLAASHPPLQVEPLSPRELREALDQAGIRHRVIAVSACYSGGWIPPLADEHTLVMTAADANSTSFGCGKRSPLTFFGRAVFDEQLRKTHSFEKAFAAAVPLIRDREQQAGKSDGFSNPQIEVGGKIRPLLQALEQRLGAGAATPTGQ